MKHLASPIVIAAAVCLSGLAFAAPPAKDPPAPAPAKPAEAAKVKISGDPYSLATCPVSGKALGSMGDSVIKVYEGREVRFCCNKCPANFEKDLAKSMAKLDEAIVKDQLPIYALDTSVVSGKKLPAAPIDWVYGNRLVRLADASEKAEFQKDPAKYMAALDKAVIEKQSKDYSMKTCPVSTEELGGMGKSKDMVVAGRMIRLCCGDCVKEVSKDPAKYIAMADAARAGKSAKHETKKDAAEHAK